MSDYWPRTQMEEELELQRARNEVLRWLVEARQLLRGETPVRIPYENPDEQSETVA